MKSLHSFLFLCLIGSLLACEESQEEEKKFLYMGPAMTVDDLNISYSDSGRVVVKMSTAKQLKMQNEDEVYPKPVYINFINREGVEYSSLRADSGKYIKKDNYYKVMGNVFFYNREAQQSLSTNELIWDPNKKIVHTDKKVQVNTPSDQIVGNGMEASQDFSKYKFTGAITGFFEVDSLITQPDSNSRALQP
ncbi:LPS export ABC transporter periplasmic protein LptC [Marinilongibacter aquaticus]|uniref:LPS export ABC transporter periplasmic protein LptC n=1 Tax=Marinilongibacter aquaticus TaxID=2975157 RepID=UPI0021BDA19C|nr:LPS export ABC transporter periplasmic protein LptC [Marinilongibacter aquaticus]UBM58872.1 LPS export ABC transporter periplasmic protein LptC [Marinilongibacter aquaticus]